MNVSSREFLVEQQELLAFAKVHRRGRVVVNGLANRL
jgi:hypothetical protein